MRFDQNTQKWSQLIKEELGVTDAAKANWMAEYARNHEIYEGLQADGGIAHPVHATPLNTLGAGNPLLPQTGALGAPGFDPQGSGYGSTGANFHHPGYQRGSGDIPMSTLTISLEVAAMTVGLELVPVIPANGPLAMVQYLDFPYAGGKLGQINETSLDGKGIGDANKPIYVKFTTFGDELETIYKSFKNAEGISSLVRGAKVRLENIKGEVFHGEFIGRSRIDNGIIVRVKGCHEKGGSVDKNEGSISISTFVASPLAKVSVGDENFGFSREIANRGLGYKSEKLAAITDDVAGIAAKTHEGLGIYAELISGMADHIQGFSNFTEGALGGDPLDPMTRAQNETGTGNTIGARFFTKMVQMGSYEVTGTVTRQQLQDMPMYGIDVVGKVIEAMQNELSQSINNRIIDRLFRLGVTNAATQKRYQGVDLNLYFGHPTATTSKDLATFTAAPKFIDIHGRNAAATWGPVASATYNTAAENVTTHQRRIMSRCLAAANLIANVGRFGRGTFVLTNTQILSALQDSAQFLIAPMTNNLVQDGSQGMYFAGSVAGLNVYVDPNMTWDDTRVLVGRKSDGKTPGVIFMPYILADQVQTVAEGTMAPKILINSRFAIVDLGMHPEQNYLTFCVEAADGFII